MSGLDRDALDRHITDGRYSVEELRVLCADCDEWTPVTATTDYGATEWSRDTCSHCGVEFPEDTVTEINEPEPPDRDDWDDRGRFEPWA